MPKLAPKTPHPQIVALDRGRRLEITPDAGGEIVEIRSPEGELELRIVLTPEGPVLRLEAVKLALSADDVAIDCKRLAVNASESADLATAGDMALEAGGDLDTKSTGDTRVVGKCIYLN